MTNRRIINSRAGGALAALLTSGLLAGCAGNALETGGADASASDLLGDPLVLMGLRADPNQEFIEYNPRSPLVLPADATLPPPQQQVALGPQWPDDPDIRAAREYEEARRAASQQGVKEVENASEPMTRSELEDWGRRFGRVDDSPVAVESGHRDRNKLASAEEMAAGRIDPNAPPVVPPRHSLTEPPTSYRVPAETADGYTPEEPKKKNFFQRMFGG